MLYFPHQVTDILTPKVILFEHPSRSRFPWDPMIWRVRLLLKYKKIPYDTVMVKYCDVEKFCKTNGIPPRTSGAYILPAMGDRGVYFLPSELLYIANYLDHVFPESPRVKYLHEMTVNQRMFIESFSENVVGGLWSVGKHKVEYILDPASARLFRHKYGLYEPYSRVQQFQDMAKLKSAVLEYDESIARECFMGEGVTMMDIEMAGVIMAVRLILGYLSADWILISSWNQNLLARILDYMRERLAPV